TLDMGPEIAVFVPRGVGNAFQTLVDGTAYSYLVNDHWSPAARDSYTFVNLADDDLAINWPIPLGQAELSPADRSHPRLSSVSPMSPPKQLILGANGQLGRALVAAFPQADAATRQELDLSDRKAMAEFDFSRYGTVLNAAAYTKVDAAETESGRRSAWAVNVHATAALVSAAREQRCTLVQISSDYVFDGSIHVHDETEPFSPLGVYGQTKAAADALVGTVPAHYVLRSSWVIGDGPNFVRTMASLADRGASPRVVHDQHGRLTFTNEIARAIIHLLQTGAPYGTYNLTNAGPSMTWADIARSVFVARGRPQSAISNVTTEEYGSGKSLAPRPRHSVLNLDKLVATGFRPTDAGAELDRYLTKL
ncbi:MAG TPA: sugar nucleotide-binding protein, partial [Propionibacteriaceae bacterium]|nr:sugar nucleotide-binding protein [Propionibacteriaceae bacterium]